MRAILAVLLLGFVGAVACSRAPEPSQTSTTSSFAPVSSPSRLDASLAPDASVAVVDSGAAPTSDVEAFCTGAYMADAELLKTKCSDKDYASSLGLERSAAKFCAKDVSTLLGFGRAKLDTTIGKACIEAVKTAAATAVSGANDTFFTFTPCDRVITGSVKDGGACRWPPECGDGLTCVGYGVGVDGTCKKAAKVGGACTTQAFGGVFNETALSMHHASCVASAYCDGKTCVARAADGGACVSSKTCGAGRSCVMAKCAKSRAPVGAACAKASDCALGLMCDSSVCVEKKSAGASCAKDQCKGWCDIPDKPPGQTVGTCTSSCGSG
jgi:hypothetical protein